MKKAVCCTVSLILFALCGCGVTAGVTSAPPDESALPEYISVERFRGEYYLGIEVADEQKGVVMDAVEEYMLKSAAWEAVDTASLDAYIHIYVKYADGEVAEYDVFDRDGAYCMQWKQAGRYSTISDAVYRPLYELAMGWHLPHTMVIQSGGESIYAVRNWIWSEDKNGLCADGMRLTPQEMSEEIEYITLADDFAPCIDGELVPDVRFTLYDENFEEREYPISSGMPVWTDIGQAGPGRYIVVAEYSFKKGRDSSGYQYFFGLIVPDGQE